MPPLGAPIRTQLGGEPPRCPPFAPPQRRKMAAGWGSGVCATAPRILALLSGCGFCGERPEGMARSDPAGSETAPMPRPSVPASAGPTPQGGAAAHTLTGSGAAPTPSSRHRCEPAKARAGAPRSDMPGEAGATQRLHMLSSASTQCETNRETLPTHFVVCCPAPSRLPVAAPPRMHGTERRSCVVHWGTRGSDARDAWCSFAGSLARQAAGLHIGGLYGTSTFNGLHWRHNRVAALHGARHAVATRHAACCRCPWGAAHIVLWPIADAGCETGTIRCCTWQ